MFIEIITNQLLWATIAAFVVSQIIKMVLDKNYTRSAVFKAGGMPSSHTAPAVALCTSILMNEGANTAFIVAVVFTIALIRDSLGVRFEVGEHARQLNKLSKEVFKKDKRPFSEMQGHKPLEILAGALIGVIISLILYYVW